RGERYRFVHVLDHLVERLEWDGAVPEHLVPRRGPGEMLLEPDHGLGEVLDLPDVETFLRVRPSVLGRLEGGIQSEGRVEALERLLEPFQPEEGETFARPRGLVPRVDPQGAVVRLYGGATTSRAILRNSSCVREPLVDRPNLRRMAERVRRSGELLDV